MRDKNRIDYILAEINKIWSKYPDLRLGQLLLNVAREPLLYYMEDENIVEALKEFYKVNDNDR